MSGGKIPEGPLSAATPEMAVPELSERQGFKVGCVEEVAWRFGLITDDQLRALAEPLMKSGYGQYLLDLLDSP